MTVPPNLDLVGGVALVATAIAAQVSEAVPQPAADWVTILLALIGGTGIIGWAVRAVVTTLLRRGDEDRAADRAFIERILVENTKLHDQQREDALKWQQVALSRSTDSR